jgi:hypothetical protein
MPGLKLSSKHLQIDKANRTILILVSLAVFVTIFCAFTCKTLMSKRAYQGRVIAQKELALRQLKANARAVDSLNESYQKFVNTEQNIIGGSSTGTGERDGDNARIILDALPSKYDFPALATSLEKILTSKNYTVGSITGTDDEIAQAAASSAPDNTAPVPIPFTLAVTGNYNSVNELITTLERSIRPIQLTTLTFTGTDTSLQVSLAANTYYQPEKVLKIVTKDVK